MAGLISLPGYNPGNALSFAGINQGIDSNIQNALAQQQIGMQQRRLDIAERQDQRAGESHTLDMGIKRTQQGMMEARMTAGRVQGILGLPKEQQAAAWAAQRKMPGFSDLPPEFDNWEYASKVLPARAQEYMDPLDRRAKESTIGMQGAHAELFRAQATAAGQKSSLDEALGGMIRGLGPQGAAPAPQGGIQPQSFGGPSPQGGGMMPVAGPQAAAEAPAGDPNLILAQTAQQAPQAAPDLSPGQDMVDTPFGRMTRQKAQQLGMAMALGGKGDAGKMMGEFAQQGMPGREARNKIEEKLFAATEQRARLSAIQAKFKPEWLTIDEQLKQYGLSWVDSFGPLRNRIPEAERAKMAEYAQFRQEAAQNMNLYIKEITGAQMSEPEAVRIRKGIPDPEKDSPTQFKAKMENMAVQSDLVTARQNYLLRRGFQGNPWEAGIPIERMQGIINERGAQIEKIMRQQNPQAPPQAIQRETFRLVKQEFGI